MSTKVTFHKDYLMNELGLPEKAIKDTISGTSRWSIHHEIIFADKGKFYRTYYSVGATESQDESPWEYEDSIECVEVKIVEKTVKVWEKI